MDAVKLDELQESMTTPSAFWRVLCMDRDAADYRLLSIKILKLLQATFPELDAMIHSQRTKGVDTVRIHSWEDYESVLQRIAWSPLVVVVEANGRWRIACDPDQSILALSTEAFEALHQRARRSNVDLLKFVFDTWGYDVSDPASDLKTRLIDLFTGYSSNFVGQ